MSFYALYSSTMFQIPDLLPHGWLVSLIASCAGLVKVQKNKIIQVGFLLCLLVVPIILIMFDLIIFLPNIYFVTKNEVNNSPKDLLYNL